MILYSRLDCPLCEDAEEALMKNKIEYTFVDIDLSEALKKQFHSRVPVLVNEDKKELGWPFDERRLREFIKSS